MEAPHLNFVAGGSLAGHREQTARLLSNFLVTWCCFPVATTPLVGLLLEVLMLFTGQLLTSLWALGSSVKSMDTVSISYHLLPVTDIGFAEWVRGIFEDYGNS